MSTKRVRIGLISDTHGLLRPQAVTALNGVDLVLHSGDIGRADILDALSGIAPVTAVRGNNDTAPWACTLRAVETLTIASVNICLLHDLSELDDAQRSLADVVVTGHSHQPKILRESGCLYVNPGSAGPRRFRLPVTVAELTITEGRAEARIIELPL